MCINCECKEYVSRPSAETINRTSLFLPIRAEAINNIEKQLFPKQKGDSIKAITSVYATSPDTESRKLESNIRKQVNKLQSSSLATSSSSALCCLFSRKQLTPQQEHDLLNFRTVGGSEYKNCVEYYLLKNPSIKPTKHRKKLLTFTERRARRKKWSEIERERKIQLEVWKKRVAHAATTGVQLSTSYEQCLELPRAIANTDGTPTMELSQTPPTFSKSGMRGQILQ